MSTLEEILEMDSSPWLNRLASVFESMDNEYNRVAGAYGFQCNGCEDNCCLTRFYHHTLLEYLYLKTGFEELSKSRQDEVLKKADKVVKGFEDADLEGVSARLMCPLNVDGLCILYEYRPMVCRLHGMEHELGKPGRQPVRSEGCDLFTNIAKNTEYIPFDRTPFYIEMAKLEGELRNAFGFMEKMKHTIAGMLLL